MLLSKKVFFERQHEQGFGLTFDDVQLCPRYSTVLPNKTDVSARFSRRIGLRVPFVSSPMDTVTESALAIELAMRGGIGVVHRNLTPEEQAIEVARVKHHLNGMVQNPKTVGEADTVEAILRRCDEKGYNFRSFPVVNAEDVVVGIITGSQFDFCDDSQLTASQIMTKRRDLITGTPETSIHDAYDNMRRHERKVLPLLDDTGHLQGMYVFLDVKRIKTGESQAFNVDSAGRLRVAAAIGVGQRGIDRLGCLAKEGVDAVVIDSSHGDSQDVINTVREIKDLQDFDRIDVIAGNVAEAEGAQHLCEAGVDGVRVGIGPGSICTTRAVTGVGVPQLTAIHSSVQGRGENTNVTIIADGGVRYPGDVPKAIGAGADCVMFGNLFAGTKEAPGEVILWQGRQWKDYRGMGSIGAMQGEAGRDRYQVAINGDSAMFEQGVEARVPYKGPIRAILDQLLGGLRHGMGLVGAATIDELHAKACFRRISAAGQAEAHPHDVLLTKDAPSYGAPAA